MESHGFSLTVGIAVGIALILAAGLLAASLMAATLCALATPFSGIAYGQALEWSAAVLAGGALVGLIVFYGLVA